MAKLVLMRHGQSAWNEKNLFTGWVDIPLSEEGMRESRSVRERLAETKFDVAFTSTLIRAEMTLVLALSSQIPVFHHPEFGLKEKIWSKRAEEGTVLVHRASALNERFYGELQGKNKEETAAEWGREQVQLWRRSYDVAPPGGESLKMTSERTLPYFRDHIVPHLERGENVLVVAHGNSLRSIVMAIENLSKDQVVALEIATGEPLGYRYDGGRYERAHLPG
jgi:2,3-bisphosphoglycerate-dependent phosphoglycerate mutase